MITSKNIIFDTDKLIQNSSIKICYTGKFFEEQYDEVYVHYGFDKDWDNTNEVKMEKTEIGFEASIEVQDKRMLNICFKAIKNNIEEWDNNDKVNYVFAIEEAQEEPLEEQQEEQQENVDYSEPIEDIKEDINEQETQEVIENECNEIIEENEEIETKEETAKIEPEVAENSVIIEEHKKQDEVTLQQNENKKLLEKLLFLNQEKVDVLTDISESMCCFSKIADSMNNLRVGLDDIKSVLDEYKKYAPVQKEQIETDVKQAKSTAEIQQVADVKMSDSVDIPSDTPEENNDNDTLIISGTKQKVFLPYKEEEIEKYLQEGKYHSKEEVIENEFVVELSKYRFYTIARVREGFKLMREKEHASFGESLNYALSLKFERKLHPAVITACPTRDDLDVYLATLDKGEPELFDVFKIKFDYVPI